MLDEMMVTKSTFPTHEWSLKRNNMMMDISKTPTEPIAVLVAISRENGLDLFMQFPKSVNKVSFKIFLEALRVKYFFDDITIVMDNHVIHKNKDMFARMDEQNFLYSWVPPGEPKYNGIEEVFSIAKGKIKKERFAKIVKGEKVVLKEIIDKSFKSLKFEHISNCINRSLNNLNGLK